MRKYLFICLLTLLTINCFSEECNCINEKDYQKDLQTFNIKTETEISALNDFLGGAWIKYKDGKRYMKLETYLSYTCSAYIYLKTMKSYYSNVKNLCDNLIVRFQKAKGI